VAWAEPGSVTVHFPHSGVVAQSLLFIAGLFQFLFPSLQAEENQDNTRVDIQFENWQMSVLAQVQTRAGVNIQPFRTDGCSGGMSLGWQMFADTFPAFAEKFGDKPPWEHCCVEHDRAYWLGETQNGYEKRLIADTQLRQCVVEFGQAHSRDYAQQFEMEQVTIETQFTRAANMMYAAVRLGGKPCSFLPWRWGYGWPHCFSNDTAKYE
jgi:hypothetical protein